MKNKPVKSYKTDGDFAALAEFIMHGHSKDNMEKLELIKVGSTVVLGKDFWYIGTATSVPDKDCTFLFKAEYAYRDDMVGGVFYAHSGEVDYVEN